MRTLGRAWHAVTAATVVVALTIQIPITAADTDGFFDTPAARVANLFTFFTILTNLLCAGTAAVLAVRPDTRSRLLAVLRVDAVVGIAVTAAVYHAVLADLYDLRGAEEVANQLFHTAVPVLVVGGWLLVGPRGLVGTRTVLLSLLYPLAWLAFTLARGAVIGWYPYPFLDVGDLGYPTALLNCLLVTALLLGLAAVAAVLDRRLPGPRPGGAVPAPLPGSGA